jgi:hypothetical protein
MKESKRYLNHLQQLIQMQLNDVQSGLTIDESRINKMLDKLKQLIKYETKMLHNITK